MTTKLQDLNRALFASLLLIHLCGCAHTDLFIRKDQRELKAALKKDWEIREKRGLAEKGENCSQPIQSSCGEGNVFEVYEWNGPLSGTTSIDAVRVKYCSSEKKYWIAHTVGDYKVVCRSFGPFSLESVGSR